MLYFFLLYVKKKYILDRYEKEKKVIAYYVNNNERIMEQSNKALHEKYEFRNIRRDEIEQAVKNWKDGSFSEWSGNESGTPDG